jgi:NAD(P)-dependent dehydrogenase (short-subunit alcohol dehydrogenase family)
VVFIAGAGKGIGEHIALSYAHAGATGLILSSRTLSDLEAVSPTIAKINPAVKILCLPCDFVQESQVASLPAKISEAFSRLDAVINNAGTTTSLFTDPSTGDQHFPHRLLEGSTEYFKRVFDLNFYGLYYGADTCCHC